VALLRVTTGKGFSMEWRNLSLDFKLMFVYHGCMMGMFMLGGVIRVRTQLVFTALLAVVLVSISMRSRTVRGWEWPHAGAKEFMQAAGVIILAVLFDLAAVPLFPPSDPRFLPWHLAGLGIAVFGFLAALKIVQPSEAEFLKYCESSRSSPQTSIAVSPVPIAPGAPLWKKSVRIGYSAAFLAVWGTFVFSFYLFGVAMRDGAAAPDVTHTDALFNHGTVAYIPHAQKVLIDSLNDASAVGIPLIILTGFALHFFGGIKIFDNVPTFEEWRQARSKRSSNL